MPGGERDYAIIGGCKMAPFCSPGGCACWPHADLRAGRRDGCWALPGLHGEQNLQSLCIATLAAEGMWVHVLELQKGVRVI